MNNSENLKVPGWEDEEYLAFVDKFKAKKTTDDCYTPPLVYDAVADWVATEYGLDKENFVRPFYPGGDYEREVYLPDAVVVDNPPFSFVTKICKFYLQHGIRFFLFAPAMTLFTSGLRNMTYLPCGVQVTYENGAVVPTSFLTNLEPEIQVRCAPSLFRAVDQANKENQSNFSEVHISGSYPHGSHRASLVQVRCGLYTPARRLPFCASDGRPEDERQAHLRRRLVAFNESCSRESCSRESCRRESCSRESCSRESCSDTMAAQ